MPLVPTSLIPPLVHLVYKKHSNIPKETEFPYNFFLKYLLLASRNNNYQEEMIEASIQFQKDLMNNLPYINKIFGCNINKSTDFNDTNMINYFEYFYNQIDPNIRQMSNQLDGKYYTIHFNTPKNTLIYNFFKPSKLNNLYFTDSPVVFIVINISKEYSNFPSDNYLNLEIDLLKAVGFTLVLCISIYSNDIDPKEELLSLLNIIKTDFFSEIHLFINESIQEDTYYAFLSKLKEIIPSINGFFYLYAHYYSKEYKEIYSSLKELKKYYNFIYFHFICPLIIYSLDNNTSVYMRPSPFIYYEAGFNCEKIRIFLYDVPLYIKNNDVFNFELSGMNEAYISPDSFSFYSMKRVPILYNSSINDSHLIKRFVEFNDIHLIRICYDFDLIDGSMDNLGKIPDEELYERNLLVNQSIVESGQKKMLYSNPLLLTKNNYHLKKLLEYIAEVYAFDKVLNVDIEKFELSIVQTYAINDIIKTHVNIEKKKIDSKGAIYQIETGEGKSAIAAITAACLCRLKKTVHIVSSNIILSIRDFYESISFFKAAKLKTAALLHYNELPYKKSNQTKNDDFVYDKKYFKKKYFGKELFKNSLNMNISVCGIDNNNKISKNKVNVVFSTITNFECLYLKLMEEFPAYVNNFFQNSCLIVDEADSILIDELPTGTILSHSMISNQDEILNYVYDCWLMKIKSSKVCDSIKKKWPKCQDMTKDDIEDMYQEIELVNQEEYSNGKKYSIEEIKINKNKKNILEKGIELIHKVNNSIENVKNKAMNKIVDHIFSKPNKDTNNKCDSNDDKNNSDDDDKNDSNDDDNDSDDDKNDSKDDSNDSDDDENDFDDNDSDDDNNDSNGDNNNADDDNNDSNDDNNDSDDDNNNFDCENDSDIDENNTNKNNLRSNDENTSYNSNSEVLKEIVPFDYDHKGILERNKEFSGFIQQFIAIKEMKNSGEKIIIKKNSMNYLYVSHPIFINLYPSVFGFTGTVGNKYDKDVLDKQYSLKVVKLPKNALDFRVELPIILCENIQKRNEAIVNEIIHVHSTSNPVLVIFQDLNEISIVEKMLRLKNITDINIFDGKSEIHKPEKVAGKKNSITLGTNVCGRGTNIRSKYLLHVIVTFYTSNIRVIKQAFGRTARNGRDGTVRIICLLDQYIAPIEIYKQKGMNEILSNLEYKNKIQKEFIEKFRKNHEWIFTPFISYQKIDKENLLNMRNSKITVNRFKAVNYEYPICMSISTFLKIQSQKIYSLYNCPNSKYTWCLFQKYIREMILESWSLFIDKAEKQYYKKEIKISFPQYLESEITNLYREINIYFPKSNKGNDMISTFIHIFNIVKNRFEEKVLNSFPPGIVEYMKLSTKRLYSFNVGFRPYSLVDESGSRISFLGNSDSSQKFITDPELKYMRRTPKGLIPLSITEQIDSIFNWMCSKIDEEIGCYVGLRFFLRRTIGGCEFGVCFDCDLDEFQDKLKDDLSCFVDKDPLLVFTINVKSTIPLLAGFLIIWMIYILGIFKSIAEWICAFSVKFSKQVLKSLKKIFMNLSSKLIEKCCNNIIELLQRVLNEQIKKIKLFDEKLSKVLSTISQIIGTQSFSSFNRINSLFNDINLPTNLLMKIGFLLLMCFASFMLIFKFNSSKIKYNDEKAAIKYDQNQDINKSIEKNKKYVKFDEINQKQ